MLCTLYSLKYDYTLFLVALETEADLALTEATGFLLSAEGEEKAGLFFAADVEHWRELKKLSRRLPANPLGGRWLTGFTTEGGGFV
jgi:hypothetical protein